MALLWFDISYSWLHCKEKSSGITFFPLVYYKELCLVPYSSKYTPLPLVWWPTHMVFRTTAMLMIPSFICLSHQPPAQFCLTLTYKLEIQASMTNWLWASVHGRVTSHYITSERGSIWILVQPLVISYFTFFNTLLAQLPACTATSLEMVQNSMKQRQLMFFYLSWVSTSCTW